jgi:predicted metal-dependent enzyme (double-stranded beta helix superfamily)
MARSQQAVPPGDDDPAAARSLRLLATAFYDVWLITWPDGSGLAAHDHGGSRSVLHVVEGELVEIFADHVDRPVPTGRVLRRGDATTAGPSFVHDLANRSGADATSLHVYSPPLTDVTFFDLQPIGGYERLRTTAVDGPEPQASSADLAPLRPPPLALVTPPDPG